jgi:DivIVA domain-containing protein
MTDEAFHLTPVDVRRYDFGSALRGYDKTRVDQFRDQVADEFERLSRVTQELEAKAKGFHEQLRAFRDREAQLILREARAEGERSIEEARAEVRRLQTEIDSLERTRRTYLAHMRSMAERHLAELQSAELASATPARPQAEGDDGKQAPAKGASWLDANVKAE